MPTIPNPTLLFSLLIWKSSSCQEESWLIEVMCTVVQLKELNEEMLFFKRGRLLIWTNTLIFIFLLLIFLIAYVTGLKTKQILCKFQLASCQIFQHKRPWGYFFFFNVVYLRRQQKMGCSLYQQPDNFVAGAIPIQFNSDTICVEIASNPTG